MTSWILTSQAAYCYTRLSRPGSGISKHTRIPAAKLPDGFRGKLLRLAAEGKALLTIVKG